MAIKPYPGQLNKGVDCIISKLSSGATYFDRSALRHLEQGGVVSNFELNPAVEWLAVE
jgi:hypothetical protein